jgi:hypothetical protein
MIRFIDNTSIARGGEEQQHEEQGLINKCVREEMEAGALEDKEEITSHRSRTTCSESTTN